MRVPTSRVAVLFFVFNICNVHGGDSDKPKDQRPIRQASTSTSSSPPKNNATQTGEPPLPVTASFPLKNLILILMAKHGNTQTSLAFNALDKRSLGEIMKILLVEVDPELAKDIVQLQNHAQNSDKQLVAVIAKIVTGDGAVANEIYSWDEKLRKFPWWASIRQRMFVNLDKYVSGFKASA